MGTLRHDEQENEDFYDERANANDDIEKGRIKFSQKKLYGRDGELANLHNVFNRLKTTSAAQVVFLPGYSGTGKSTLVREFMSQLQQQQGNYRSSVAGNQSLDMQIGRAHV